MNLVRIYQDGYRTGLLCKEGRVHAHVVVMGCPIDSVKVPVDDDTAMEYLGGDAEQAKAKFLDAAKRLGITERAKALLVS